MIVIRPYVLDDRDAVNAVARAAFAQYADHYEDWPSFIEGIGRMADLAADADVLVAEQGGTIVGAVAHVGPGRPRSAIFPPEWSVIRMLVVDPRGRGQGVGRKLVAGCLRLAQEAGAPTVGLHTSPIMASALRMYESIGFVRDRGLAPIRGVAYGRYVLPQVRLPAAISLCERMDPAAILIRTPRLILRPPVHGDAEEMLDYYQRNQSHFRPWEPRREPAFYTLDSMRARIDRMIRDAGMQASLHLLLLEPGSDRILGECGFTNIVRGPFQACHLGFSLCQQSQGKGLMHEALCAACTAVFSELGLHRVMANYRPENERSHKLLQRLGFEQEGRARSYLKIDGRWTDHVLTSLVNDSECDGRFDPAP